MKTVRFQTTGRDIPVQTIYGIGRNYAKLARELNNPVPTEPVVFLKPLSALVCGGCEVRLPEFSRDVHHEGEIALLIGRGGKNISEDDALSHIAGYAAGIDFTARDLQQSAKEQGLPWAVSKGFDGFAPVSEFVAASETKDPLSLTIRLSVNGALRQNGSATDMIFSIPKIVSMLSRWFTLFPGDVIFTGTPEGVGPVKAGDRVEVVLGDGLAALTVTLK